MRPSTLCFVCSMLKDDVEKNRLKKDMAWRGKGGEGKG